MARTQRGSVTPDGVARLSHASCACAGIVNDGDFTTRSGGPPNTFAKFHTAASGQSIAGGMSLGSPIGAPASTQRVIVSISTSESDRSFLNSWMPMLRSTCHGGICRAVTRALIDFAHGRASWYETSDIGAIESGRWHVSHLAWKMGATSFVKVGALAASAAAPGTELIATIAIAAAPAAHTRSIRP